MDPLFTKVINAETSAESIIRDRLEALDQWMRDPIHDPLAQLMRHFEPGQRSDGSPEVSGDAALVMDPDWTPTAAFVAQVMHYLQPERRTNNQSAKTKKDIDLRARNDAFMVRTAAAQKKTMEQRAREQRAQEREALAKRSGRGSRWTSCAAWSSACRPSRSASRRG